MQTINHECYVDLEVANLLKEAGFDWEVNHYYFTQNGKTEAKSDFKHPAQNYNEPMATMDSKSFEFEVCSRPTLDVAQRWLREVMTFDVLVLFQWRGDRNIAYKYETRFIGRPYSLAKGMIFDSYEEAQEAGIRKCLTILLEK